MRNLIEELIFVEEFAIYLNYARKLQFEDTPDYDYLRGLFDQVLEKKLNAKDDGIFDWMLLEAKVCAICDYGSLLTS